MSLTAQKVFENQIERFRANYGPDRFPDAKCRLIWEELKEFNAKQIESICNVILSECSYSPVFSHFHEKACQLRAAIAKNEREREQEEADLAFEKLRHDEKFIRLIDRLPEFPQDSGD